MRSAEDTLSITLYYAPFTRSMRVAFLLEEMGVPYTRIVLDRSKGEHKTPEYLRMHPHGLFPVLRDGDTVIYETAAICLHLADRFPEKGMAPPLSSPERALYYQWMIYAVATLEPPISDVSLQLELPEERRNEALVQSRRARFAASAEVLTRALQPGPYLLGERFSAADVVIGMMLIWARTLDLLTDHPVLQEYVARIRARPAFRRC
jgi:glutathione S-transferase